MAYYCRLSFNSNGWFTPSGHQGKSRNSGNHENEFGFGFEEWLFNDREFKNKNKQKCHLGYIDPLRGYIEEQHIHQDLVLYTIRRTTAGTERFIVARLEKEEWRFINHEEYLTLRENNAPQIAEMRNELMATMPMLRARVILNRFDQQRDCLDWLGQPTTTHRLFNIQILKNPFFSIMERITNETLCPDWHISKLNRFTLYDSENFNHEDCN